MNVADFTVRATTVVKQMVLDKLTDQFEKSVAGVMIAGASYKAGDLLRKFGAIDADGNVDIGLIDAAIGNGVEWPLRVELPLTNLTKPKPTTLRFEKSDFDTAMRAIRGDSK